MSTTSHGSPVSSSFRRINKPVLLSDRRANPQPFLFGQDKSLEMIKVHGFLDLLDLPQGNIVKKEWSADRDGPLAQ